MLTLLPFSSLTLAAILYGQSLSGYPMISHHPHHPYPTCTTSTATDSLYTPPPPFTQIKMEYPPCVPGTVSSCMMPQSSYIVPMAPPPPCTSATGLSMPSSTSPDVAPSSVYSSISSTGRSLQDCHISEVCCSA